MNETIFPAKSRGTVPSTQVPFILLSSLSNRTLRNSYLTKNNVIVKLFFPNLGTAHSNLDVMLHEGIERFPSKALCQFLRSDRTVAKLKFIKDSLQSQSDAPLGVIAFSRHFVNSLTQLRQNQKKTNDINSFPLTVIK